MPFALENHLCYLRFYDERLGEFVYELIGTTELPTPTENIPF